MLSLWEDEKQRLGESFLKILMGSRDDMRVAELLKRPQPESFQAFLVHALKQDLQQQQILRFHPAEDIAIDEAAIQKVLAQATERLVPDISVKRPRLAELIRRFVAFQVDVLARPRQLLAAVLFHLSDRVPGADILELLSGFDEKRPFVAALQAAVAAQQNLELSREEFESLARTIEAQTYSDKPLSAIMTEIQGYVAFCNQLTQTTEPQLPSGVLLALLAERHLLDIHDELKLEAREKDFWTLDEIENALQRHFLVGRHDRPGTEEDEIGSVEDIEPTVVRFIPPKSDIHLGIEESMPETEKPPRPFKFRFDEEFEQQPEEPLPQPDDEKTRTAAETPENENEPGVMPEPEGTGSGRADSIEWLNVLEPAQLQRVREKIFRNNEQALLRFFERIADTQVWSEAKTILDTELDKRKISVNADEAVLLGDMIFSRFQTRQGS